MLELRELKAQLDASGISPTAYSLGQPFKENSLCLNETAFSWEIFFLERGDRYPLASAGQFSDAAEEFLRILQRDSGARAFGTKNGRKAST
jgi:hypothetical protein